MAIIERPSTPALAGDAPTFVGPADAYGAFRRPVSSTGWRSWLFTVDHKKIGIMYGVVAFAFFTFILSAALVAGVIAVWTSIFAGSVMIAPDSATVKPPSVMTGDLPSGCTFRKVSGANWVCGSRS